MKELYRRHNTWWIRFTPAPGAQQVRQSLGTTDEARAVKLAKDLMEEYGNHAREGMGSADHEIDRYIDAKKHDGLAKASLSTRKYVLKKFIADVGITAPKHIARATVMDWFQGIRSRNPHTAEDYLKTVQRWFKWMKERGKLTVDVTAAIKLPKLPMRQRRNFLKPEEAHTLINSCTEPGLRFAVYCGLHAGMRKLEVIEARPGWFDLKAGLIHLQATSTYQPKDRDNRTIPMTNEFRKWLEKEYGIHSPFMLAPKVAHGKYRYRFDFKKSFDRLAINCGFDWLTFHDLRRTFASLHASSGTSIYKIAQWMGDGVEVVENHYGYLSPQDAEINRAWTAPKT